MKKRKIQIDIPQPCDQQWNKMTPNYGGRFCLQCEKTVIDFTHKTDREIAKLYKANNGKLCGRFFPSQLKRDIALDTSMPSSNRLRAMGLLLSGMLTAGTVQGQDVSVKGGIHYSEVENNPESNDTVETSSRIVSGTVSDETGEPLIFVNLYIEGTKIGTTTDLDGNFTLKIPAYAETITVSYVGYEDKSISLKDHANLNDVKIELDIKMEYRESILMGVVICTKQEVEKEYYHRKTLVEKIENWKSGLREKRQNKVKKEKSVVQVEPVQEADDLTVESPVIPGVVTYKPMKNIFPNPFVNELNLEIEGEREETLQLMISDELGRELHSEELSVHEGMNQFTINVQGIELEYGKCFISLLRGNEMIQTEVLMKRRK